MAPVAKSITVFVLACSSVFGCGSTQPEPSTPIAAESPPAEGEPPAPSAGSTTGAARPEITAQACEAAGGTVVGDIGDGAIHRPDYQCTNGKAPTGTIRAPEGGPIAIEGSVCCPK